MKFLATCGLPRPRGSGLPSCSSIFSLSSVSVLSLAPSLPLSSSSFFFLSQGLSLVWNSLIKLGWLIRNCWVSFCLCLPRSRMISTQHISRPLFHGNLGHGTQSSSLQSRHLRQFTLQSLYIYSQEHCLRSLALSPMIHGNVAPPALPRNPSPDTTKAPPCVVVCGLSSLYMYLGVFFGW